MFSIHVCSKKTDVSFRIKNVMKETLWRPGRTWDDNIKKDFKGIYI
jgi:hypothetical protein